MIGDFEVMPVGEEYSECCDCEDRAHHENARHRQDMDDCGECHNCEKPLP